MATRNTLWTTCRIVLATYLIRPGLAGEIRLSVDGLGFSRCHIADWQLVQSNQADGG
jgi:hypothetical protein